MRSHVPVRRIRKRARALRAGFTLVELMVSLAVGGVAISAIYAIGSASTRQFQAEHYIATTQTSLRTAMAQVKRDLGRAGYLATPDAALLGESCAPPTAPLVAVGRKLAGVGLFANDVSGTAATDAIDPDGTNAANGFTFDQVLLYGNYETSAEYSGVSSDGVDPAMILISQDWHAFRRDFTNWFAASPPVYQSALFNEVFTVGRLIRLRTVDGRKHFAQIIQILHPGEGGRPLDVPVAVRFNPPLPADCITPMNGGFVAPVSAIGYDVELATGNDGGRFVNSNLTTGPIARLIRRDVNPAAPPAALANDPANTRGILDYVTAFNLDFVMNAANRGKGISDQYAIGVTTNAPLAVNGNPERIRSIRVTLAARAPLADPNFQFDAAACANLRCFQVLPDDNFAARVRVLRGEVFVPNIAYEGF